MGFTHSASHNNLGMWISRIAISVFFYFFLGTTPLWAGDTPDPNPETPENGLVQAILTNVTETYTAVGTVKPRSEMIIESQVGAQVENVHVQAGDSVQKGDILITLDNRQPASRLDRARQALHQARAGKQEAIQGVRAAEAAYNEAKLHYERIKKYYSSQAATKQELENAESGYLQAKAGLNRSKDAMAGAEAGIRQAMEIVSEATVGLGFTRITAPAPGEVIKRMVEPGDLALPGKPLISLRTEDGFRIEAHVREGLIGKVHIGMTLKAEVVTLEETCDAVVEEIVPYADPSTRTFLVKAALPLINGLYPGMYGKLLIPESEQEVVMVPYSSVVRTGQLELLRVRQGEAWQLRYVKTGKRSGEMIEVLSGLKGNEVIKAGRMSRP